MWFSVALVKFHWFGINWQVFNQSKSRNCCLCIIIQKITPQAKSGKYFQIWFFPPIWGEKMAAFWACACKLSWTLLSPARVQPLYGAGRKESSGTGLAFNKPGIGGGGGGRGRLQLAYYRSVIVVVFWQVTAYVRVYSNFYRGNEWACDGDSDNTFHTWLQLSSCICLNSLPTKYHSYLLKLISIAWFHIVRD